MDPDDGSGQLWPLATYSMVAGELSAARIGLGKAHSSQQDRPIGITCLSLERAATGAVEIGADAARQRFRAAARDALLPLGNAVADPAASAAPTRGSEALGPDAVTRACEGPLQALLLSADACLADAVDPASMARRVEACAAAAEAVDAGLAEATALAIEAGAAHARARWKQLAETRSTLEAGLFALGPRISRAEVAGFVARQEAHAELRAAVAACVHAPIAASVEACSARVAALVDVLTARGAYVREVIRSVRGGSGSAGGPI